MLPKCWISGEFWRLPKEFRIWRSATSTLAINQLQAIVPIGFMIKFHIYQFTIPLIDCVIPNLFTNCYTMSQLCAKILDVQVLKQNRQHKKRQRQRKEAEKWLWKISPLKNFCWRFKTGMIQLSQFECFYKNTTYQSHNLDFLDKYSSVVFIFWTHSRMIIS